MGEIADAQARYDKIVREEKIRNLVSEMKEMLRSEAKFQNTMSVHKEAMERARKELANENKIS